ncbi:hypothetical protein NDU88_001727 [Pleurodeles waltl]|uniref:Uncharacterized protein n=1 Tax=Pleurodeles waltl TaxID=8319 RepID=A0AAV7LDN0_PLEWA|nr:hypothetical protein NDU88_001727 [Pleurodeles waltl]
MGLGSRTGPGDPGDPGQSQMSFEHEMRLDAKNEESEAVMEQWCFSPGWSKFQQGSGDGIHSNGLVVVSGVGQYVLEVAVS